MFTRGEFTVGNVTYGAIMSYTKTRIEAILVTSGTVVSAYLVNEEGSYSYNNVHAKELVKLVQNGVKACTSKNCSPVPFELGAMNQHEFIKAKVEYTMQMYRGEVVGAYIQSADKRVEMEYISDFKFPDNIPYIKLTEVKKNIDLAESDLDAIQTRSVEEIALEKEDTSWLKNKQYFIVNDDETAEKLFTFFDNYNGPIAYDTETTGLKINCFGQINSKYQHDLEKYNAEHSDNPIRADKLVGIIFCVQENTSYYFPCFNRKFKNLYDDLKSPIRNRIINNTKAAYTIGAMRNVDNSVADYWRKTPADEITPDCILMERVRHILETKHIVAHNGSFEFKVGLQYWIDTNLKDDTMIIHQVAYKFRNGGGKAEPSNLKYLAKKELGVDQWELHDFFPNWKPDKEGLVRRKPGAKNLGTQIDFSYMDYPGTRVYAPTDGDVTLCLFHKFKSDLLKNHKEMEYIYNVEIIVACAIGYMEFFGHRIDESKILSARAETLANKSLIESEIRQMIDYSSDKEIDAYNRIKEFREGNKDSNLTDDEHNQKLIDLVGELDNAIAENVEKQINLGSSAQVCDLFYNKLNIPCSEEKQSVAKKVVKGLMKEKDDEGKPKYPVVHLYSKYKNEETLLSKFFDNLIYFTYPGGFIFSSFGQIATNTGRMSCSKPNCQQYPKVITKIIIPRDGYVMMDADYSQIEYRVLTAMAGNDWLAELFSNPDSDYHTLMASLMYGVDYSAVTSAMRSAAKSFNFGIPYGMGLGSLAILLTGKNTAQTRDEAAEKMEDYFANQPRTRKFFIDIKEMAQVNGFTKTLFNRYRYYSFTDNDGNVNNAKKAAALRQAGNAVIQGCLAGNTRIQTKELGIVKIKDAVNTHLHVWDGKEWADGDILYSGKKQKCIVKFSNGQRFICSPIHKFLVRDAKGKEKFIECKDLATRQNSKNPNRIVVNPEYCESDYDYTSDWARGYDIDNAKNAHLDNLYYSFDAGVLLGRLAFNGTVVKMDGHKSYVLNYIAENEKSILPELKWRMEFLGDVKEYYYIREKERGLCVFDEALVDEIQKLNAVYKISDHVFNDTEMLRGFLRGIFDGNAEINDKTISLTFEKKHNFTKLCNDIQKALLFFGIRSRVYDFEDRYKVTIKADDNKRFMKLIGFINEDKKEKANSIKIDNKNSKDKKFGRVLIPESVEITDEYIDMYDVCNTTNGYYVADGIVTHNTAADIFKIGVARNFSFIRRNGLLGKLLIINMIHDEQLMEVDVQHLNMQRILAEVGNNMQFKIDGFPPLFIGAGIGKAWGYAKGKMAEIHPVLLEQFTKEAKNIPIWRTPEEIAKEPVVDVHKVLDYFDHRVYEFRRQKVAEYLSNPENWHKAIYPAISGLINLQFNYGRGDDAKAYTGPNGEKYTDQEFLELNIGDFLKENHIDADPSWFKATDNKAQDEEEDKEYSDGGDEDDIMDMVEGDEDVKAFKLVDESDKTFGSSIHDMINVFGACILVQQKICGINTKNMYYKKKDALIDYLMHYICDENDPGALQIVFLTDSNVLNYTGIYVKNLDNDELEKAYKSANSRSSDFTQGDVKNRSQAK